MENLVVFSSLALTLAFGLVWLLRPDLRAWIERPKHRFQQNVRSYDEMQKGDDQ